MSGTSFSRSETSLLVAISEGYTPSWMGGPTPDLPETWEEALLPSPLASAIEGVGDSWMQFMMAHDDDLYLPKWW